MFQLVYRVATTLAGPLTPFILARRVRRGKEEPSRIGERRGKFDLPRPVGNLIWVHAASVGESMAMLAVIDKLLNRDASLFIIVTTQTVTAARLLGDRLPLRAFHQFAPLDRIQYARRFLDHWRPNAVIWTESELWPNMVGEIRRRGIPAALVNARISEASAIRWQRFPTLFRRLMESFCIILPGGVSEAAKLQRLGISQLGPSGNLKYAAAAPAVDDDALAALRRAVASRPLWLAASTHEGEEAICLQTHRALAVRHPDLLTVIAPRHPQRGAAVASMAREAGFEPAMRSDGILPDATTDLYVADTLGEMGTLLALSPLVFLGGSLVPVGGHNPAEPAHSGAAIITGPFTGNFADMVAEMESAGGLRVVADAETLADVISSLLDDPSARALQTSAARAVAVRNAGVLDRALEALVPILPAQR